MPGTCWLTLERASCTDSRDRLSESGQVWLEYRKMSRIWTGREMRWGYFRKQACSHTNSKCDEGPVGGKKYTVYSRGKTKLAWLKGKRLQGKKRETGQQRPMRSSHFKRGRLAEFKLTFEKAWLVPNQIQFITHLCSFSYKIKNEFSQVNDMWMLRPSDQSNVIPNYIKQKHYTK